MKTLSEMQKNTGEKLIRELENENNKIIKDISEIHNREKT